MTNTVLFLKPQRATLSKRQGRRLTWKHDENTLDPLFNKFSSNGHVVFLTMYVDTTQSSIQTIYSVRSYITDGQRLK